MTRRSIWRYSPQHGYAMMQKWQPATSNLGQWGHRGFAMVIITCFHDARWIGNIWRYFIPRASPQVLPIGDYNSITTRFFKCSRKKQASFLIGVKSVSKWFWCSTDHTRAPSKLLPSPTKAIQAITVVLKMIQSTLSTYLISDIFLHVAIFDTMKYYASTGIYSFRFT